MTAHVVLDRIGNKREVEKWDVNWVKTTSRVISAAYQATRHNTNNCTKQVESGTSLNPPLSLPCDRHFPKLAQNREPTLEYRRVVDVWANSPDTHPEWVAQKTAMGRVQRHKA